jgi:hypothetical protein
VIGRWRSESIDWQQTALTDVMTRCTIIEQIGADRDWPQANSQPTPWRAPSVESAWGPQLATALSVGGRRRVLLGYCRVGLSPATLRRGSGVAQAWLRLRRLRRVRGHWARSWCTFVVDPVDYIYNEFMLRFILRAHARSGNLRATCWRRRVRCCATTSYWIRQCRFLADSRIIS